MHERTPEDDVLILGCDGVWDVFSSQEAVGLCREIFNSGERDMALVSEELIDMALNKGTFCSEALFEYVYISGCSKPRMIYHNYNYLYVNHAKR